MNYLSVSQTAENGVSQPDVYRFCVERDVYREQYG